MERWQAEGLAVGTIKNRMAELRWWAEKIGKQNVIARDNDHYGIGNRQYVTNVSKARELSGTELGRIIDSPRRSPNAACSRSDIAVYGSVIRLSSLPVNSRALLTLVTYCRLPMP